MEELNPSPFWPMIYTLSSVAVGVACLFALTIVIPRILSRFTPHIEEEREIAAGNQAVAEYHGRIVSSLVIGVSIIIAAALLVGLH